MRVRGAADAWVTLRTISSSGWHSDSTTVAIRGVRQGRFASACNDRTTHTSALATERALAAVFEHAAVH